MPAPPKGGAFFKPKAGVSYETEHRSQKWRYAASCTRAAPRNDAAERKLWYQFLRRYPVKIYKQRIIESFIADFYCSRAQLVIELDGAQHTTEQGLLYDRERSSIFSQYGLDVLRFSNYEVDLQFEAVCEKIHQTIQSRL